MSEWTSVALPSMIMSLPGCCFSLVISSTTFFLMMVDSFQGAVSSVVDTTYFFMRLRTGPAKAFHRWSFPAGTHRLWSTPPQRTLVSSLHPQQPPRQEATSDPSCPRQRPRPGSSTPSPRASSCSFSFPIHSRPEVGEPYGRLELAP